MKIKIIAVFLTLTLFLSACQSDREPVEPVEIDPLALQTFTDKFFEDQMQELHIPGVTFIFIQGGEVIFSKGYGYANMETESSINPDSSVVRIGSVSKLFVATAAMQLVEQGQLDLHSDVNQYLKSFQLEDTFPEVVTLAQLLTHTAGYEDPPEVTFTDPQRVPPLGSLLATDMPPRTYPPGEAFIYSNYAYALAGLIVEEVSHLLARVCYPS